MTGLAFDAAGAVEPAATPPRSRLTIGEELERVAPGWTWPELCRWPPDVFAFTSAVLGDSGIYRTVVCPPAGASWPPEELVPDGERWHDAVGRWAAEWAEWLTTPAVGADERPFPEALVRFGERLAAGRDVTLADLEEAGNWPLVVALLALHAMADEACPGSATTGEAALPRAAAARLAETGSLARLAPDRVRVLPKLRTPESGITLRSVSRHLAVDRSEVESAWYVAPRLESPAGEARFTMLLVPYPTVVHAADFRPVRGPLRNMDEKRYGLYEFEPHEPFDPADVVALVASARRYAGAVDAVVLPEAALEAPVAAELQRQLWQSGVPYLVTGVRGGASEAGGFGVNYAHFGTMDWSAPPQHKHHRWCLDPRQVEQYHLGAALDPGRRWWEAIRIHRRRLTFVTVADWLTVCPLVCEDLARPDPVTDVVRAVGPTLVIALLLDGPQLAARWPARYASVLADDPGCSVLTLTSLGMAERSQPPGAVPSRVIALWKDPRRGLQQIPLDPGARAVALTAHARFVRATTADGRVGDPAVAELVLSGIEQVP